jgi:hypothetical protein
VDRDWLPKDSKDQFAFTQMFAPQVNVPSGNLLAPSVGVQREGMVYELFVSTLPSPAFTAKDVPLAMDVESSSGTRTAPLCHSHANNRIRSRTRSLAGSHSRADGRSLASFYSGVWPCAMGTPFV